MRSLRSGMMVGIVLLLTSCGGGSGSSLEENSGEPPRIPPAQEKARLEHQVEKHNRGASVTCSRADSATDLDLWDCKVEPKNKNNGAEVEVLGPGFDRQYEITECRTSPNQGYSQTPRGICAEIH